MFESARLRSMDAVQSRISNWNPQLVREIKGRWKGRNLSLVIITSLLGQLLIYFGFRDRLPSVTHRMNRYCIGTPPADQISPAQMHNPPNNYCLDSLVINWELWWLDLFTWLSVIGIIILLVTGIYLLISDLSKEEQSGTLSFVRLSPRSVTNLLVGKILGVPILVYLVIGLALPLHFASGIAAKIPVSLVAGFYLVVIASCAFFFSVALLYGLVTTGLGSFQAWLGTGVVFFFLFVMTNAGENNMLVNHNPFDWVALFYPGRILPYLLGETPHSLETIDSFNLKDVVALKWYTFPVWNSAGSAIALLIINYAWWTYWAWQGLTRRFRNPHATLVNKQQSYWFTGSITVSVLGFMYPAMSGDGSYNAYDFIDNFRLLLTIELVAFLLLIIALSPHRQTLQDWARYRYQKNDKETRNLLMDLMRGEQSPAPGAIALNLLSNILIVTPALFFFPLEDHRLPVSIFAGVLITSSAFLMYACIAQLFLFMKTPKRSIFAIVAIGSVMFLPLIIENIFGLPKIASMAFFPIAGLFAAKHPMMIFPALLVQWVVITGCSIQLTRQLKKAGESNTKALFAKEEKILISR